MPWQIIGTQLGFVMKQAGTQLENKKRKYDGKTTNPVVVKKRVIPNYLAVVFMSATPTCMKFAISEQNLSFVIASIIASQYDFPSTARGNATFSSIICHKLLLSSLHLLQLFGSSCFLAKWLLLHK